MNFGIKLTAIAIHFSVVCAYSQDWNTSLNNIPIGGANKFGTNNCVPVDIYTRNQLRLTIDTNGVLRSTNLAGTGGSFLRVTSDGELIRADQTPGDVETWECNMQMPWVRGGNTVGSALYGNLIGTCDNYDFILKAYNKQALFVKAANSYIGIGHNNITPSAQLDIFNPSNSNTSHFKIHGDAGGSLEAGANMNLIYNGLFSVNSGNYSSNATKFQVNNNGNTGVGNVSSSSWKLLVHATSIDGIRTQANLSSSKALQVFATNTSKEAFTVFGDGKTVIGDESGATNSAKVNVNVNNAEAINVFDASGSGTSKVVFRVETLGKTTIGDVTGATSNATLNVNLTSGDAINVCNPSITGTAAQHNKVTFRVQADGKTYIGPDRPKSTGAIPNAMLSVDGGILAREVRVAISPNTHWQWSDYVFEDKYVLQPLSEIELYVKKHKHLPNLPSTKQVSEEGLDLGEMHALLLAKIEELYLHTINQQKEITGLQDELQKLRKANGPLSK